MSTALAVDIAYQGKKGRSRRNYLSGPASSPVIASLRLSSARAALVSAKRAAHWPAATWRSASGHGHTMATGDTAPDPFSRPAQYGRSRPRGCAASGCGDRHHAGLLPRAGGTLRSPPGSQGSAVQKREEISKCRRR